MTFVVWFEKPSGRFELRVVPYAGEDVQDFALRRTCVANAVRCKKRKAQCFSEPPRQSNTPVLPRVRRSPPTSPFLFLFPFRATCSALRDGTDSDSQSGFLRAEAIAPVATRKNSASTKANLLGFQNLRRKFP